MKSDAPSKQVTAFEVGKDILDVLTGAMYVDPMNIIREYIQNAADSIDEARTAALYNEDIQPRIDISTSPTLRTLRIRDNGTGIIKGQFFKRLLSLGSSSKKGKHHRGFRGIGRLCGLGYCQEMIFRSKAPGEMSQMELHFDSRKLRDVLIDDNNQDELESVLKSIVTAKETKTSLAQDHFFEVELLNVRRIKNDLLLNEDEIKRYLSETGPVPFGRAFSFAVLIDERLRKDCVLASYEIFLNGAASPIYRPHVDIIRSFLNAESEIRSMEFFEVPGVAGGIDAIGWIAHHDYKGALERKLGISGLRVRSGNIQIGANDQFAHLFPEPRFNSWTVGEVHVFNRRIIPNARRDDFEHNSHYENLVVHLSAVAARIAKRCRQMSSLRNRQKEFDKEFGRTLSLLEHLRHLPFTCSGMSRTLSLVDSSIQRLRRFMAVSELLDDRLITECRLKIRGLEQKMKRIKDRQKSTLEHVPRKKREAYIDIFDQIFTISKSPKEASLLITAIVDELVLKSYKKYNARRFG